MLFVHQPESTVHQEVHMLKFYFNGSPNPTKVALFLEEAGLPYEPVPIDPRRGAQFSPEFLWSIRTVRCQQSSMTMW